MEWKGGTGRSWELGPLMIDMVGLGEVGRLEVKMGLDLDLDLDL